MRHIGCVGKISPCPKKDSICEGKGQEKQKVDGSKVWRVADNYPFAPGKSCTGFSFSLIQSIGDGERIFVLHRKAKPVIRKPPAGQ
jgi:hypothetical protein